MQAPQGLASRACTAALIIAAVFTVASSLALHQPAELLEGFWYESLSSQERSAQPGGEALIIEPGDCNDPADNRGTAVFHNGAWDSDHSTSRNAYVAGLLSKDVYYKHLIDPRDVHAARHNFTLFTQLFCRAAFRLGVDDCEVVSGAESLVWAVLRAGPSVLLVIRGSSNPQNWIADVASLRRVNVGDFGGGSRGVNVALGFFKVFTTNRRAIVGRVLAALDKATMAATAAFAETIGAAGPGSEGGAARASCGARLWILGHSLGGAVALMAAAYLDVMKGLTATGVYTYGCPQVGDETWEAAYPLHSITLRLENTGDIIPTLPFGAAWRHVGTAVSIQACKSLSMMASAQVMDTAEMEGMTPASAAVVMMGSDGVLRVRTLQWLRLKRREVKLRGGDEGGSVIAAAVAVAARVLVESEPVEAYVDFPFPVSFREHWIETYVQVMWSCLPEADQELVPGPQDVYISAVGAA